MRQNGYGVLILQTDPSARWLISKPDEESEIGKQATIHNSMPRRFRQRNVRSQVRKTMTDPKTMFVLVSLFVFNERPHPDHRVSIQIEGMSLAKTLPPNFASLCNWTAHHRLSELLQNSSKSHGGSGIAGRVKGWVKAMLP